MDTKQPAKKHMLRRSLFIGLPLLTLAIVLSGMLFGNSFLHQNQNKKAHAASSNFKLRVLGGDNLCLNAPPDKTEGTRPYLYTCNSGDPNQQWHFGGNDDNKCYQVQYQINDLFNPSPFPKYGFTTECTNDFSLVSVASEQNGGTPLCLDHNGTQNHDPVYMFHCYNGDGQAWHSSLEYYYPGVNGAPMLHTGNGGLHLLRAGNSDSLDGGANANAPLGTNPYLHEYQDGNIFQKWNIEYV